MLADLLILARRLLRTFCALLLALPAESGDPLLGQAHGTWAACVWFGVGTCALNETESHLEAQNSVWGTPQQSLEEMLSEFGLKGQVTVKGWRAGKEVSPMPAAGCTWRRPGVNARNRAVVRGQ